MADSKADDYRRHAQACLEVAQRISMREDRVRILQMAQRWLELAAQAETKETA